VSNKKKIKKEIGEGEKANIKEREGRNIISK